MSFSTTQARARRVSRRLILLLVLGLVAMTVTTVVVMLPFLFFSYPLVAKNVNVASDLEQAVFLLAWIVGGALLLPLLALLASLLEVWHLSSGGQVVAERIAARRVVSDVADPLERRLFNVVQEMSIASGVPMPSVWVMDAEDGINAFVAGQDAGDSVMVVTRGALRALNRDELQAVIGHEFSHLLNGDCRLNIRMLAALAGIEFLGWLSVVFIWPFSEVEGSLRHKLGFFLGWYVLMPVGWLFLLAGLLLWQVGAVGRFFALLIKASLSRQREFLADASSVQFTRNPLALAGALARIEASGQGTLIRHRYAAALSHLFFGQAVTVWWRWLFATHPTLRERISLACPGFDSQAYLRQRKVESIEDQTVTFA
jgi:Zn-dependent protease with chaperone function